ncbi:MAG: hypothetical protein WDM94_07860 [Bauldia sp.]
MTRYASAIAMCVALLGVSPASSAVRLADVTADGHWDCKDPNGAGVGAVVLADKSYAFIKADGKLAGYGKLFLIRENFDLPHFAILDGHLKDEVHALGIGMRGPRGHQHDLSGDLFVNIILSADGQGKDDWECVRRGGRG